jgi:hypothetical protein
MYMHRSATERMMRMHPRLAEIVTFLEDRRGRLTASVAGLPESRLNARPEPGAWSAVEILDHLASTERGVAYIFAKRVAAAGPDAPREVSTDPVLGRLDALRIETVGEQKRSAPEQVLPRPDVTPEQALAALEESRAALLKAVAAADGLALDQIKHSHPGVGELDLYQWLLFVGKHEERHTAQLLRAIQAD